jgi:D-tyrosyl-tRNA(Tyr) deacylase
VKLVVQRVKNAYVEVDNEVVGKIQQGILIYLGVLKGDTEEQAIYLAKKVVEFRMFHDENKKMNRSLLDIQGQALVVSQFTLVADGKKGHRPSFDLALEPQQANILYERFIEEIQKYNIHCERGKFGAYMQVYSQNDGPVTFVMEK